MGVSHIRVIKKLFRILTVIQISYYIYDWIKSKKSLKEEFVPEINDADDENF